MMDVLSDSSFSFACIGGLNTRPGPKALVPVSSQEAGWCEGPFGVTGKIANPVDLEFCL